MSSGARKGNQSNRYRFVLDKSASMSELTAGTNSQTKNAALIEAVNEMSKDLL